MQRLKDVPSLISLCRKSLEDALFNTSENFITNEGASFDEYSGRIESCKMQFHNIPSSLHDELAKSCLHAADRIAKKYCLKAPKLLKCQVVVQQLVSVVTSLKVKKVHFGMWSHPVRISLLNFLWKMTHLEILLYENPSRNFIDLSYPIEIKTEHLKKLEESLPFLPNLKEFAADNCTDEIIATLCENCKLLEKLVIDYDSTVTDSCIDSLIPCSKLQRVWLTNDVTANGFMKLLLHSQSNNLVQIGEVACLENLLDILETNLVPFRTFQTQEITYSDIVHNSTYKYLPLIPKYFPCLKKLDLYLGPEELKYFASLDSLKHTEEIELSIFAHGPVHSEFYSLKSEVLTTMFLDSGLLLSVSGLINVGLQCPNLKSLSLENCSLAKDLDLLTARNLGRPFQKLKSFSFHSNSSVASGAEMILVLATNIKHIRVSDSGGVTDVFMTSILKFNALEELRRLHFMSDNISLNMVESIILNCKKITSLGHFGHHSDNPPNERMKSLQMFIAQNNYKIDLS